MRRKRGKGSYILPNLFTSLSLLCGFYSILSTFERQFERGSLAILVACVFDMLDGKVARATGSESKFGLEYDSLSDAISFGIAPSVLSYFFVLQGYGRLGFLAAFLFLACGVLRLARFNIQAETVQKRQFLGLPIPAAALMVASSLLFYDWIGRGREFRTLFIPIAIFVLSFLMVSEVRYPSLKEVKFASRRPFHTSVLAIMALVLALVEPRLVLFSLALGYVLSGPILMVFKRKKEVERVIPSREGI